MDYDEHFVVVQTLPPFIWVLEKLKWNYNQWFINITTYAAYIPIVLLDFCLVLFPFASTLGFERVN